MAAFMLEPIQVHALHMHMHMHMHSHALHVHTQHCTCMHMLTCTQRVC